MGATLPPPPPTPQSTNNLERLVLVQPTDITEDVSNENPQPRYHA